MATVFPLTVDVFGIRHRVADVEEIPSTIRPGTVGLVSFRPECGAFGAMVATPDEAGRWVSIVTPTTCPACALIAATPPRERA